MDGRTKVNAYVAKTPMSFYLEFFSIREGLLGHDVISESERTTRSVIVNRTREQSMSTDLRITPAARKEQGVRLQVLN